MNVLLDSYIFYATVKFRFLVSWFSLLSSSVCCIYFYLIFLDIIKQFIMTAFLLPAFLGSNINGFLSCRNIVHSLEAMS